MLRANNSLDAKVWKLQLEEKPFPATENCYGVTDVQKGFRLTLTNEETGESRVLNDDNRVPKSRGCPFGYIIEEVVSSNTGGSPAFSLGILIRVIKPGFEGNDADLLGLATRINN